MADLQFRIQSIPKPDELDRKCEDKFHVLTEDKTFIISDGAGGVGVFADEWADFLVNGFNKNALADKNTFSNHLHSLKLLFYQQKEDFLDGTPSEFSDAFFMEGSAATFVAVSVNQKVKELDCWAIGDSCAMLYKTATNELIWNIEGLKTFTYHPHLVNCADPSIDDNAIIETKWKYKSGDFLLLATDAIAQWLLIEYLTKKEEAIEVLNELLSQPYATANYINAIANSHDLGLPFKNLVKHLWSILKKEQDFRDYAQNKMKRGHLAPDDYTLCMIKL
jgi:hypothetical protein